MEVAILIFRAVSIGVCLYLIILSVLTARKVILIARVEIKLLIAELAEEIKKENRDKQKLKENVEK